MPPCGSTTHKENHLEYEQDTETLKYETKNLLSPEGFKKFILEEKKPHTWLKHTPSLRQ